MKNVLYAFNGHDLPSCYLLSMRWDHIRLVHSSAAGKPTVFEGKNPHANEIGFVSDSYQILEVTFLYT